MAFGPGPVDVLEPIAGLSDLASYKASLNVSFTGNENGQPSQWSRTYEMLSTKAPAERQLTILKSGDTPNLDPVYMAEVAGAAYERHGTDACNAAVIDAGKRLGDVWEPATFLSAVLGADEAGTEMINGLNTRHLTFDERALGLLGVATSTGGMWVAVDGGYVVRETVSIAGGTDYFGQGTDGSVNLDYELTGVGEPTSFVLPADCPAGMVDIPPPEGAVNLYSVPGLLTYDTTSSIAEISAFYQAQGAALGWTPTGESMVNETVALLSYTRGTQETTVTATAAGGVTTVEVILENQTGPRASPAPTTSGEPSSIVHVVVANGPQAGTYDSAGVKADCSLAADRSGASYGDTAKTQGVTGLLFSSVEAGAHPTKFYFQVLFGAISFSQASLEIVTLDPAAPDGTGTAALEDSGGTIKWTIEGTTADGIGVMATIECGPVDRP